MCDYEYDRATPEMRRWFEATLRVLTGRLDEAAVSAAGAEPKARLAGEHDWRIATSSSRTGGSL